MLKHGLEGVNLNNPIKDKLPQIIEYFVKFYGEKYRERITTRLNDTIYIFVDKNNSNRVNDINIHFDKLRDDLFERLIDRIGFKLKKVFDEDYPCENITSSQLKLLSKWRNGVEEEDLNSLVSFLRHFNKNLSIKTIKTILTHRREEFYDFLIDLDNVCSPFISDFEYLEKQRQMYLYPKEHQPWLKTLQEDYQKGICEVLKEELIKNFKIPNTEENLNKINKYLPIYLDIFENGTEIIPKNQEKDYLSFFKFLESFNKEQVRNNLSDFIFDKKFKKSLKGQDLISNNKIALLKQKYQEEAANIINGYRENLSLIYSGNFVHERDLLLSINQFKNFNLAGKKTISAIMPALTYTGPAKLICLGGTYFDLCDSCLVHELNHIVEFDLGVEDNKFIQKTGFDVQKQKLPSLEVTYSSKCEAFNEVINDYLSLKVFNLMKEDNFTIGHDSFKASSYSRAFPLLEGFIEKYQEDIIENRMNEIPFGFAEKIGKDNFYQLAAATEKFLNITKFNSFDSIIKEIKEKENCKEVDFFSLRKDYKFTFKTNEIIGCFEEVSEALIAIENRTAQNEAITEI